MAEVVAVRGNVDTGPWANELQAEEHLEAEGRRIWIVHDIGMLTIDPAAAGIDIVIYGHSHQPASEYRHGVLYLNPGSAGPRRFRTPVSMAVLRLEAEGIVPEIIEL
jgi:hypothetical protein